jgi:hypothetical protein
MSISRRQLVISVAALPWLRSAAAAPAASGYFVATLGSSRVIAAGLEPTTELASALLQVDELLRTLCNVAGPVAGAPVDYVVLTGAELRRVREATGQLDSQTQGDRNVSVSMEDARGRLLTCNGDRLRSVERRMAVHVYWLAESELLNDGRAAEWYRAGYRNMFGLARFKSSTEITIGGSSSPAKFTAQGGAWLPLRELMSIPLRAAISGGTGMSYLGQTFYLAHYLSFARPELRPAFAALAQQGELASPEAVDAACAATLPLPLAEFETALQAYSRGKHMTYTYPLKPFVASVDNPRPLTREALDAEVAAVIDRLRPLKA